MNLLFLCTGNSCRSILAEATFNHLAPAGFSAASAGSRPIGAVHPQALALLAREGIATTGLASKSWDTLPETPDLVITVCGNAAGEVCPAYLRPTPRAHWGVADPAAVSGSAAEVEAAFALAYRTLRLRIEAFLELSHRRAKLEDSVFLAALARLGTLVP